MKRIKILPNLWRESGRELRFFFMSGYAAAPILIYLLHWAWWTFIVMCLAMVFLFVIEQFGYSPIVAILALRARLAGRRIKRRRSMFNKHLD